jgi:hypothetical protein
MRLDTENGLSGPPPPFASTVAHSADGFSGQNEFAKHYIDAIYPAGSVYPPPAFRSKF